MFSLLATDLLDFVCDCDFILNVDFLLFVRLSHEQRLLTYLLAYYVVR